MRKTELDYELTDGTIGTVRILAADKVQMERAMRTNSWPVEDGPQSICLMIYFALRRQNKIKSPNFDAFLQELVDFAAHTPDEDEDGEDLAPL